MRYLQNLVRQIVNRPTIKTICQYFILYCLTRLPESKCVCDTCINSCKRCPGAFLPYEINKLPEEVRLQLVTRRGFINANGQYVNLLAPKLIWGRCIFLLNDRCSIYSIRPHECRVATHRPVAFPYKRAMLLVWEGKS